MRHTGFQGARTRSNSASSRGSSPVPGPVRQPVRSFSPTSDDDIIIPTEPSTQEESERPILRQPTAFAWTGQGLILKDPPKIPTYAEPVAQPTGVFLPGQDLQSCSPPGSKEGTPESSKNKGPKRKKHKSASERKMGRPRTTRGSDPFEQHCFKALPNASRQRNTSHRVDGPVAQPTPDSASTIQRFRVAPPPIAQRVQEASFKPMNSQAKVPPTLPSQDGDAVDHSEANSDVDSPAPASSQPWAKDTATNSMDSSQDSQPSSFPPSHSFPRTQAYSSTQPAPSPNPTNSPLSPPSQDAGSTSQARTTAKNQPKSPGSAPSGIPPTSSRYSYAQYYPGGQYHGVFPAYYQSTGHPHYHQQSRLQTTPQQAKPRIRHANYNPAYYKRIYEDDAFNTGNSTPSYYGSSQSSSQGETSIGSCGKYPTSPSNIAHQPHSASSVKSGRRPVVKPDPPVQQQAPPDGSTLRVVTLLLKDLRVNTEDDDDEGELQLVEIRIPLRDMDEKGGFWADSKDICQHLQSGPARIDGPAKVYTRRQQYKQIILRISEDNEDIFTSANVIVPPTQTVELFIQEVAPPKMKKSQNHAHHAGPDGEGYMETTNSTRGQKRKRGGSLSSNGVSSPQLKPSCDAPSKKTRLASRPTSPQRHSSPSSMALDGVEPTLPFKEDAADRACKTIQSAVTKINSSLSWDNLKGDNLRQLIERYKFVHFCLKQWHGRSLPNIPGHEGGFPIKKEHVYNALKLDKDWIEYFEKTWPLYVAQTGMGNRLADVNSSKFADQPPQEKLLSVLQEADKLRREAVSALESL